jgi:hypothetical protein
VSGHCDAKANVILGGITPDTLVLQIPKVKSMPTIQSMELPIPKNWQDFETMVRDALAQRWNSTTLQKNGRPGQQQNGVDIHGPDNIGRPVGIQCKRYKPPLKLQHVTDEIVKAETFEGQLTTLFIATTADHDAKLQQQVRILSDKRVAQGKFAVALLFWDEIVGGLLLNPAVFRSHYPQVVLADVNAVNKERLLAALEFGYYGADLWAYIILIYGEFGWMAQADPDQLIANLRILECRAQLLLSPCDAAPILDRLAQVRTGCLSEKVAKSDWAPIEVQAKQVSQRLQAALSLLPMAESNVLDLALQLGRIFHHADDLPTTDIRADVEAKVRGILPDASGPAIEAKFRSANLLTSGYQWAMQIYSLVNHELRFKL